MNRAKPLRRSLVKKVTALIRLAIGVAAGLSAYMGLLGYEDIRLTATTLVAVSGTLAGFLMTAMSVLISASDRRFMENLKKTGHYEQLFRLLIRSTALWLCVIVVGMAGHFLAGDLQAAVVAVAAGLMMYAMITFAYAGTRFSKVMVQLARG